MSSTLCGKFLQIKNQHIAAVYLLKQKNIFRSFSRIHVLGSKIGHYGYLKI